MDEITADGLFERYQELLSHSLQYGFPACCSAEELRERMAREKIRVFVIGSSPWTVRIRVGSGGKHTMSMTAYEVQAHGHDRNGDDYGLSLIHI